MISASKDFKEKLKKGENTVNYADFTLSDGTVLHLEPKDFMIGGCSITDKTTDGKFGIGFVIGKTTTLKIANHDERFSQYDFYNSSIYLYVAMLLDDGKIEKIRKGRYYTTVPETPGDIIEISAVDGMFRLDRDYADSTTKYPATLQTILTDACLDCGIPIGFRQFDNMSFVVKEKPEKATYRQVVSYVCQIAGYNARIDNDGYMQLIWYNTKLLDWYNYNGGSFKTYPHDTIIDGGNFKDYSGNTIISGGLFTDEMPEHIYQTKSLDVHTDDVQITGVRVVGEDGVSELFGEEGYLIEVSGNPFVIGKERQVADYLGKRIVGMTFRPFSAQVLNNPLYEPFDIVRVSDRKGNVYVSLINSIPDYKIGSYTQIACEAEDPIRNGTMHYSDAAAAVVEARRNAEKQITEYDKAVQNMNELAANSMGLFTKKEVQENGSYISYESDRPITVDEGGKCHFENGSHVWKRSDAGFFVSDDGGETYTSGFDKNSNVVINILYAIGIVADWIRSGRIICKKGNKTTFFADVDTGEVRIIADSFSLTSGDTIESIAKKEVNAQTQKDVFNKLTNNGSAKGIYLDGNILYINANYINTGTISANRINGGVLVLGGANNENGEFYMLNSSNAIIGKWNNNGLNASGDIELSKVIKSYMGGVTKNRKYSAKIGELTMINPSNGEEITTGGIELLLDGVKGMVFAELQNSSSIAPSNNRVIDIFSPFSGNKQLYLHMASDGFGGFWSWDKSARSGYGLLLFNPSSGKTSVAKRLEIDGSSETTGLFSYVTIQTTSGWNAMFVTDSQNGNYHHLVRGTSSSKRYKDVKRNMTETDILDLYHISPVLAKYKEGYLQDSDERSGTYHPMFIAEDVEKYVPSAVDHNGDGQAENWNYRVMIPCMFQMIKSQKETIDNLIKRVETLENLMRNGGV